MSDLDRVAGIRRRLAEATPGPWYQGRADHRYETRQDVYSKREPEDEDSHLLARYIWSISDAALIASAPADLAWACDRIERLSEALTAAMSALRTAHEALYGWDADRKNAEVTEDILEEVTAERARWIDADERGCRALAERDKIIQAVRAVLDTCQSHYGDQALIQASKIRDALDGGDPSGD